MRCGCCCWRIAARVLLCRCCSLTMPHSPGSWSFTNTDAEMCIAETYEPLADVGCGACLDGSTPSDRSRLFTIRAFALCAGRGRRVPRERHSVERACGDARRRAGARRRRARPRRARAGACALSRLGRAPRGGAVGRARRGGADAVRGVQPSEPPDRSAPRTAPGASRAAPRVCTLRRCACAAPLGPRARTKRERVLYSDPLTRDAGAATRWKSSRDGASQRRVAQFGRPPRPRWTSAEPRVVRLPRDC